MNIMFPPKYVRLCLILPVLCLALRLFFSGGLISRSGNGSEFAEKLEELRALMGENEFNEPKIDTESDDYCSVVKQWRLERIRKVCQLMAEDEEAAKTIGNFRIPNTHVNDVHKTIMCVPHKAGSESWR